ncbi:cell division and transport-associated protein TolR [Sulfuritortus calidifontis]|uniref:Cell division and transport-associated protein TolR n=1 Tax=Sulfuritortus calidifontis TaxID=1914471 RepID=A0A4R3JZ64_9PROT|nr:protein TolR [Sulfuritortus calidifontis]TCS74065.1 cell division and transport-associated protein TolR [Sulfuritortus calidifontis]
MSRRPRKAMNQINVVPYIDVMLVLLVIFMVTAPFINPAQVELPSVGKSATPPVPPLELTIKADGSYWLRDRNGSADPVRVAEADLADSVRRRAKAEQPVVIAADKSVRYEAVMRAMDVLQRAGIARVGLLVKPVP